MSTAYHPRKDGQTERTNQVLEGFTKFLHLRPRRLVLAVTISRIRLQQFLNQCTWNITLVPELRLSSTDGMVAKATGSKSWGQIIQPLDEGDSQISSRSIELYSRGNEKILRPKSITTAGLQRRRFVNVKWKKYSYKTTLKETKAKALGTFENHTDKRTTCF